MKKLILVLAVWAAFSSLALAQSNYKPGYVIRASGDTLKGYINFREWTYSPKSIQFKENVYQKEPVTLTPASIKGFADADQYNYLAYTGPVSADRCNFPDLPGSLDTTTRQDTCFLKIIATGPNVSLMQHRDEGKTRFFIMNKRDIPVELVFHEYYNINRTQTITANPWRKTLLLLLQKYRPADSEALIPRIATAEYNLSTIINAVSMINNGQISKSKASSGIRFFAGVGANYTHSQFTSPPDFKYEKYASSILPMLTVGFDFVNNPTIQRLVSRIELLATASSVTFKGDAANFNLSQYLVLLKPQFSYNFYNAHNTTYFIGAAVSANISAYTNTELVANRSGIIVAATQLQSLGGSYTALKAGEKIKYPYSLSHVSASLWFKAGVVLNNRLEIALNATPYTNGLGSYTYNIINNYFTAGVNYLFEKPAKK